MNDAAPTVGQPESLLAVGSWPVPDAAAGWVDRAGRSERTGATDRAFELASVTKPLFALAVLVAVEEGSLDLDQPIEIPGATIRHLLAHGSGLAPDERRPAARAQTRRIYSNAGFELLGELLEEATGFTAADYVAEAVVAPLHLTSTVLHGSPAHGAVSSVDDLLIVASELMAPTLIDPSTLAEATTPQFADLSGVLPGFGRQTPNPWGLGFEIRGDKSPHWTSPKNSPATFGHFGRAGTMIWVDPVAGCACVALSNRNFGPWAADAWPPLSTAVLDRVATSG